MTAPVQAPEDTTSDNARSPATDHGPRTTDSARAGTDSASAVTDSARAAANRLNAQKSTGPRTPEGKAKSALNALKHGLTSQSPLLPTEDPTEYQTFAAAYLEELNPNSIEQFTLAQQLVTVSWKLSRIPKIEAKIITELVNRDPILAAWRQECDRIKQQNSLHYRQQPLPPKPAVPSATTDDLIAESFLPTSENKPTRTPVTPLHRLRQYHTQLLNTYLRLLKRYESALKNEANQPEADDQQPPAASAPATDYGPPTSDAAPAAKNEPILPQLSTRHSGPSTSLSPSARLHAAINSVPIR